MSITIPGLSALRGAIAKTKQAGLRSKIPEPDLFEQMAACAHVARCSGNKDYQQWPDLPDETRRREIKAQRIAVRILGGSDFPDRIVATQEQSIPHMRAVIAALLHKEHA